ncbi:MAG: 4-phosphopantetheinyl transferase family protein, partial [Muribaculaceae bacterium]|nr:4-phosphopantetheinyl transferase family protein [Muribaculaceae bacterium]
RQQVLRVRDKYLNASEKQFIAPNDLATHIIAWTAKEAIIKAERNSALDWTDGICLDPFSVDNEEIVFSACCGCARYRLTCRRHEGHYVTVAEPAVE